MLLCGYLGGGCGVTLKGVPVSKWLNAVFAVGGLFTIGLVVVISFVPAVWVGF
jgi:hypothetical protein